MLLGINIIFISYYHFFFIINNVPKAVYSGFVSSAVVSSSEDEGEEEETLLTLLALLATLLPAKEPLSIAEAVAEDVPSWTESVTVGAKPEWVSAGKGI